MNEFFKNTDFDIEEPAAGHEDRFLQKLRAQKMELPPQNSIVDEKGNVRKLWTPILEIAATLLLIVTLAGNPFVAKAEDLASVSPQMKETQQFYTSVIKAGVDEVNTSKNPQTEAVIKDALNQLQKLDEEYSNLKKDLLKSGKDKRVIFAMVSNLQQRMDLLKNLMTRIDKINELKNNPNENNSI